MAPPLNARNGSRRAARRAIRTRATRSTARSEATDGPRRRSGYRARVTSARPISRRALLRAMAASSIVAALAACGVNVTPPPTPSSGAPSFGATGRSPVPTAQVPTLQPSTSPAPSPAAASDPAALRRNIARLLMAGFRGLESGPDDAVTKALATGLGGVTLCDREQSAGGQRNSAPP